MKVKFKPCGDLQTNCYILSTKSGELIIDPGMRATEWVVESVKNPIAILNTHGHYDHVWSNSALQKALKIPLYTPKDDLFLLKDDIFDLGLPESTPDYLVEPDEVVEIKGVEIKFLHFPGHTPGCSMIEIGDFIFSGDFIFKNSIGRSDFPYSNNEQMLDSLERFEMLSYDKRLYPGHGPTTTIKEEQGNISLWKRHI